MPELDRPIIDGTKIVSGGVNSALPPGLVAPDQIAWLVNGTLRNGNPECRPGWFNHPLRFKNAAGADDATLAANFKSGRFQGKAFYDGAGLAPCCMLYSIGGRIFRVTLDFFTVADLTPTKILIESIALPFTAPAIAASVNVTLYSVAALSLDHPSVLIGGKKYTLTAINGLVGTFTNVNDTVGTIVPRGTSFQFTTLDRNANNLDRIWTAQADRFLVIQDGQSRAFIFDGSSLRRATRDEVPTGTIMQYSLGRLWVASPDRRTFYGGDIIYGSSGTPAYGLADGVLKFTENKFINGGGEFAVPLDSGLITGMRMVGMLDTALGGPLEVFTERSIFNVVAPTDRTEWQNTTYPIKTISMINFGAESQWSTVLVNGDIWYRSSDGFRSFQSARREFGTWANTPLSSEVDRVVAIDDSMLLWASSGVNFDNRLLMTISPHRNFEHGICHRGLAVLSFDTVSGMREQDQPQWEGIWTGLDILQVVTGNVNRVERCFVTSLNAENEIELWELSTDEKFDSEDQPISRVIEYRSFGFPDLGWALKELKSGDVWLERLTGQVDIVAKYRPDRYPKWQFWDSGSRCANYKFGPGLTGVPPTPKMEQYRPRVSFKFPEEVPETANNKPLRRGDQFQVRLEISGSCRIAQTRVLATALAESPKGKCLGTEVCQTQEGFEVDEFTYMTLI